MPTETQAAAPDALAIAKEIAQAMNEENFGGHVVFVATGSATLAHVLEPSGRRGMDLASGPGFVDCEPRGIRGGSIVSCPADDLLLRRCLHQFGEQCGDAFYGNPPRVCSAGCWCANKVIHS